VDPATFTLRTPVAPAPDALRTRRRTAFVPGSLNLNWMVRPVPSGQLTPPRPSGPSSVQVYVHGPASQLLAGALNVTACPAIGVDGE
jgi:hypothetical protein